MLTEQNATEWVQSCVCCAGSSRPLHGRRFLLPAFSSKLIDQMGCKANRNFALQIARLHGG